MTDVFGVVVAALFGAVIGSFLNACIYRLPRGQSIVQPRSSCSACGHELAWFENVPVVSYVALLGRCRVCKAPIARHAARPAPAALRTMFLNMARLPQWQGRPRAWRVSCVALCSAAGEANPAPRNSATPKANAASAGTIRDDARDRLTDDVEEVIGVSLAVPPTAG